MDATSLVPGGPYAAANMAAWNRVLDGACHAYRSMRVFAWSAVVQPSWFISDGIHYSTPGSRWRARMIAEALAAAFPDGGSSASCVIR